MLNYIQIKEIITEKYGFKTLADYQAHLSKPKKKPTQEEIDILSPDRVNCREFWNVADDLFGIDPVCNISMKGYANFGAKITAFQGNRANLWIAKSLGVTAFIDEFAGHNAVVVEIGAGYGSLKNYIESTTKNQYFGWDVVSRCNNIYKLNDDGTFPEDVKLAFNGCVQTIVSTNVFQHLTDRQRLHYIEYASHMVKDGGLLIFNGYIDNNADTPYRADDGKCYTELYGQLTPAMTPQWVKNKLKANNFRILVETRRWDNVWNYVAQREPRSQNINSSGTT